MIGKRYKIKSEELKRLKSEIMKGTILNEFGDYACGCSINPKFSTINRLCAKHQGEIKEIA